MTAQKQLPGQLGMPGIAEDVPVTYRCIEPRCGYMTERADLAIIHHDNNPGHHMTHRPLGPPPRPERDVMFMAQACLAAARSTCIRRKVGVIVTTPNGTQVVGIGYNGNAAGLSNACDSTTPGSCGCIHAETNALIKTPYDRGPLTMYTTLEPCVPCAKLIINSAVTQLIYLNAYRSQEGQLVLSKAGVTVRQLNPRVVEQFMRRTAESVLSL